MSAIPHEFETMGQEKSHNPISKLVAQLSALTVGMRRRLKGFWAQCLKCQAIAKLPEVRAGAFLGLNRAEGHEPTSASPAHWSVRIV